MEGVLPDDWAFEVPSPEELTPSTLEPGLPDRAVPILEPPEPEETNYTQLYRLTRPYYDTTLAAQPPTYRGAPDPASFRPVTIYEAPVGLQPRTYRAGVFEIYPYAGVTQSFETNVNLSANNPVADFYFTPKAGVEFQAGTPDSIFTQYYDTIVAVNGLYEAYGDIFFGHPEFSAFNQRAELTARIGRSSAIWRPYVYASDLTGSNLLMAELINRTRRIRVLPGLTGEYQFTDRIGANHNSSYYLFQHVDPQYINYTTWRTQQELTYKIKPNIRALLWTEYRYTRPSAGSEGNEFFVGTGWLADPDPRLHTELRIGWDFTDISGYVPGRWNMSGVRFNGYTTFDWGPRFRLTFRYDRDYVFNEIEQNDNYVSTLLQLRGEIYLGGNWYITPYLGTALQEFETSHRLMIQYRPELEISYALPNYFAPNEPKIFVKGAYMRSEPLKGQSDPIEDWRFSVGCNFKF